MKKRVFAAVLALAMLLGLIPGTAFATDPPAHSDHPICGASCSGHTESHENVEWTPWDGTGDSLTGGNYYLTQSVTRGTLNISGTVNLCLNGNTISSVSTLGGGTEYLIKIGKNNLSVAQDTLNLCDCKGIGAIKRENDKGDTTMQVYKERTLNLYGGTIMGKGPTIELSGGTVNLYGGTVIGSDYSAIMAARTDPVNITILGGTVTGKSNGVRFITAVTGSSLTLGGSPTISGESVDIYLSPVMSTDASVTVLPGLTGSYSVVWESLNITEASPGIFTTAADIDYTKYFTAKNEGLVIQNTGEGDQRQGQLYLSHVWATAWTTSDTHHWHKCANDTQAKGGCTITEDSQKDGYAAHSGGTATCKNQATCTVCKKKYGDQDPNNHVKLTPTASKPATCTTFGVEEYWSCSDCGQHFSNATGTDKIADLDTWKNGEGQIPMTDHDFTGAYLSDANGHWHKCANCDATDTKANHVYDSDSDTTCDACGYQRTVDLSKVVQISGISETAKFGEELTAAVTGAPADVTLKYAWTNSGGGTVLSTDSTYTPAAGDVGKTLTLTVSTDDSRYTGTVTFTTGSVAKGEQAAPGNGLFTVTDAVQGQNNGAITISGDEAAKLEYRAKPADGSDTNYTSAAASITDLPAGTYQFRYKATDTHDASPAIEVVVSSREPEAQDLSSVVSISGISRTVKLGEELTATVTGAPEGVTLKYTWTISGSDTVLSRDLSYTPTAADVVGKTLTFTVSTDDLRYTGTVTFTTGPVAKGEQAAPGNGLFTVTDAVQGQNNGAITISGDEAAKLEYRAKPADGSDTNYTSAAASITDLPAGAYQFRYKATDTHNASPVIELEVPSREPEAQKLTIGGDGSIAHGSVTAGQDKVTPGDTVKLTVTPETGYELTSLAAKYGDGQSVAPTWDETTGTYTFTMPDAPVTVTAAFTAITYTIDYRWEGVADGSFTVEDPAFTLAAPVREGYTLTGWSFTENGPVIDGVTAAALIAQAANKFVTLYPVWSENTSSHGHSWSDTWSTSSTYHWHQCIATDCPDLEGSKKDSAAHAEDGGTVTTPATDTAAGVRTYKCAVCGYVLRTEEIPMLEPIVPTYSISGTVTEGQDMPAGGVTVKLMQGNRQIGESVTTNAQGIYSFPGISAGTYNVVAEKGGVTKTILVVLTNDNATGQNIQMPDGNKNSIVEVTGSDTPPVVVGGVDKIAEAETVTTGQTVTVTLTVEKKEESAASGAQEIKQMASGKAVEFLDLSLVKTLEGGSNAGITKITDTGSTVLEIVVPYVFTGKKDVAVYRHHDNSATELTKTDTKADGTFRLDEVVGLIYIYASRFSTYAIGYTETSGDTPITPPDKDDKPEPPAPSHSGGSSSPATYSPIIEKSTHGEVEVKPSDPAQGDRVTVTLTPDKGYQIDSITVTDREGRPVTVTDNGKGTYTFIQPMEKVTITASFKADGGYSSCPKDHTCPIARFPDASPTAWYHDGVHYCLEHGLMEGYDTGLLGPDDHLSRAHLVQMLYNQAGRPDVTEESSFEDVAPGAWYAKAVAWAQQSGIVSGYDSRHFYPDGRITREQLATILWRHAGSPAATGLALDFTDADNVSGYAADALRWAVDWKIIYGKGSGILDPTGLATRAEAASMLMRYGTINNSDDKRVGKKRP